MIENLQSKHKLGLPHNKVLGSESSHCELYELSGPGDGQAGRLNLSKKVSKS